MKLKVLCALLSIFPAWVTANENISEKTYLCHGVSGTSVVVNLWKSSKFSEPVHCIRASFFADTVFCAPNGGWGLSNDETPSTLIEITNDWKTAHEHEAGKVTAISGSRGVRFNAQYGEGVGSNLSYEWKFSLDIHTGKAAWYTKDGHISALHCDALG